MSEYCKDFIFRIPKRPKGKIKIRRDLPFPFPLSFLRPQRNSSSWDIRPIRARQGPQMLSRAQETSNEGAIPKCGLFPQRDLSRPLTLKKKKEDLCRRSPKRKNTSKRVPGPFSQLPENQGEAKSALHWSLVGSPGKTAAESWWWAGQWPSYSGGEQGKGHRTEEEKTDWALGGCS